MAELKKCPFCGGEAKHEIFDDGFFTWGRVECKQCGAMITTPPVNTIEAWNNRATEAEDIPIIHGKAELELHDKVVMAKAYERFAERIKFEISNCSWQFSRLEASTVDEIAEQLKEE